MSHVTKVVSGRVKNEIADRLVEIAKEEKVTKSEIIERAIKLYDAERKRKRDFSAGLQINEITAKRE